MRGREIDSNDIAHALTTVNGNFDRGISRKFFFADLSVRDAYYPCYVVRIPNSAELWVATNRAVHQGMVEYYRGVITDTNKLRGLQGHMSRLDRALETDYAAERELAGEHLWFYKTPQGQTPLELSSLVDLRRDMVRSVSWTIAYDRAAQLAMDTARLTVGERL